MDIRVSLNSAMVIAVVAVELMNMLWYSAGPSWARRIAQRLFPTTIVCDIGLVLLLQILIDSTFVRVSTWLDVVKVAVILTLVYFCLEAPHFVSNSNTFLYFLIHSMHKFCMIFVMLFCIVNFNYIYVLI
ncbi:uncharacterized protein LOC121375744 [Gigantopelta aegis]|uniref:uncharacterized protein LOC121375744 n=1 Tax=Gigantopelta aegis TaxID=1735272 RepID=UPI001B889AB0|nr:uncharacterized protein LOC121375744 [Gigantopelta aegis]